MGLNQLCRMPHGVLSLLRRLRIKMMGSGPSYNYYPCVNESSDMKLDKLLRKDVKVVQHGNILMDTGWRASGVTAQFMEDSDIYHERYFNRLDFEHLMDRMLSLAAVSRTDQLTVLDIGSGGGSSVFAAARLLPNSHIVGSDISPHLLEKMADFSASSDEFRSRISAYCFDLHAPFFRQDSFDVVVGCAILHHLLDPYAALNNVALALKDGGKLILCEPLEAGNFINATIYDAVITLERQNGASDEGRLSQLMVTMRRDLLARLDVPKTKPFTKDLDDKWVFDTTYLSSLAAQLGMKHVEIFPVMQDLTTVFETSFRALLAESGNSDIVLPAYVEDLLREFDAGISSNLKSRFCPVGIIIFTR